MAQDGIDVVKAVYEAFARGDVPAVLGAMTQDVAWHEAEGLPYGGVHRGPEAVAERVFGPLTQDVPDFAVTPEEFVTSGGMVVALARYTGTAKETGARLDLPVVHVWDVANGKVTRFRQFVDTVKFVEVLEADPAAA